MTDEDPAASAARLSAHASIEAPSPGLTLADRLRLYARTHPTVSIRMSSASALLLANDLDELERFRLANPKETNHGPNDNPKE